MTKTYIPGKYRIDRVAPFSVWIKCKHLLEGMAVEYIKDLEGHHGTILVLDFEYHGDDPEMLFVYKNNRNSERGVNISCTLKPIGFNQEWVDSDQDGD